jgi:ribosome-binding ATPase
MTLRDTCSTPVPLLPGRGSLCLHYKDPCGAPRAAPQEVCVVQPLPLRTSPTFDRCPLPFDLISLRLLPLSVMEIGIIGLPSVGKTSLFNIVTRAGAKTGMHGGGDANQGTATVPDERLDWLSALYKPKKHTPTTVGFVDVAGLVEGAATKDSFSGKFLASLRAVDGLVHVVRLFENDMFPHPADSLDAARDIRTVETELILGDLGVIEKRLERLAQDIQKNRNRAEAEREVTLFQHLQAHLETEQPLRTMELTPEEQHAMRGYTFLTAKPMIYAVNLGEGQELTDAAFGTLPVEHRDDVLLVNGVPTIAFQGELEAEIAQLPPEEVPAFLLEMGITRPAADTLIRTCFYALDVIAFFTVGEDENRAWTTGRGDTAPVAAGRIHSDLERGFIRAEVVAYADIRRLGTMHAVKEAGLFRIEGKNYIVKDGDILNIRFNV